MFKRLLSKRILFVLVPLVLILAGAGFFLLGGAGAAPFVLNITINQPSDSGSAAQPEQHLTVSLGERIVNLADPGGYRYLKTEVVVEVAVDQKTYEKLTAGSGGGGHGGSGSATDPLRTELEHVWPKIQDTLTMVLSSKTAEELSTPEGKEQLKAELAEKLQPAFGDYHITEVYLTQFVIQ
ncbi:flagellar basal body-associated FliL family protein [Thermomicrobium sp. 4228-Ro]|uniref:flagellar basal body-associated FliL family protein n=1 Tax=Thermomicrobium sp. 4228-Ro TaxID=2993937 RepID=UPI0022499616|nr:flagellar basal body-associated FliL family protein [Thermomicrobium sp. 4228-Ro]MCX2727944.1 flagellar basal body-associated FliL family protein [Thermomicrobium sp. 4228-Ro]